ncbi:hypothetical protein H257_06689 [Aphanomyces astaci]|uniref:Tc1-like transposase DDE domain-containing protein n=1 Tax=Aphanomyces astaci TaxID=112090 RepID=W4GL08_APHAT|nr:hypothetical protein H257_06689 [Aphanomyces astaci]ETV80380.1 hypothetical protein H257_06689 [Aphanomyces astaci]|eukprot:XP_009830304.1 hypothetical protein H257_06689 [Aphanomyces astaci]
MDILWLQATLRYTNTEDVAGVVSQLLGRARKTVKGVLAEYLATHNLSVVQPPSNTTKHHSRVPDTHAVRALVQRFIRDRCVTRTRTVAKDVLSYLVENHVMAVDDRKVKDYAACLRAVQVFLANQGYACGKRTSTTAYRMSKAHEEARDAYVGTMVPTVTMPLVVRLYAPTDDVTTKPKHKGRRYCFIAGILDEGSDVSHLLGLDIFVGGKKNSKKAAGRSRGVGVVFGRVCHGQCQVPQGEAKVNSQGNVEEERPVYQACVDNTLTDVAPTDLKPAIWKTLKKNLDEHVLPVVVAMAQARGHHVVYAAPGFSELQPIEMVWSNVKETHLERLCRFKYPLPDSPAPMCYVQRNNILTHWNRHHGVGEDVDSDWNFLTEEQYIDFCEKANGDLRTIVKGRVQDSDDGNTENQGIEEDETADTAQPSPPPAPTAASKKPTRKRPRRN